MPRPRGFVLLPALGFGGALRVGAALGAGAGLAVALLDLRVDRAPSAAPDDSRPGRPFVALVFFAAGFVSLGVQVVWARHLTLLVRSTVTTYSLTLTVVLLGIVLGSVLASFLFDRRLPRAASLGALQVLTGLSILVVARPLAGAVGGPRPGARRAVPAPAPSVAILSGATFPLAVRMVVHGALRSRSRRRPRWRPSTRSAESRGSLVVGFGLLPRYGIEASTLVLSALGRWARA